MRTRTTFAMTLLSALSLATACLEDPPSTGNVDAGVEVDTPTVDDVSAEVGKDAAKDQASPDVLADSPPPPDISPDTVAEVTPDTVVEVTPDAAPDVTPDTSAGECCFLDSHCGAGRTCAEDPDLTDQGRCVASPVAGQCWDKSDCGEGELCTGATFCLCGQDCGQVEAPGVCEPMQGCCSEDTECGGNDAVCAKHGDQPYGRCMTPFAAGQCWSDTQCGAGQACVGAFFCPCWNLCGAPDIPGTCQDLPTGCCVDDAGCASDQVCEAESQNLPGVCKTKPNGPACAVDGLCCWSNSDCAAGGLCTGASVCGCLDLCPNCGACQEDTLGACTSAATACCQWDGDCPAGWACGGASNSSGGPAGMCKPASPQGECWGDSQCPFGQTCVGEEVCPCDADCGVDKPGTCSGQ